MKNEAPMTERRVLWNRQWISYRLERKRVKNLNLRVREEGIYVSAGPRISTETVDAFVASRGAFILAAQGKIAERKKRMPLPKQYVSGECFQLLGQDVLLEVERGFSDTVTWSGSRLRLSVMDVNDDKRRQRVVERFLEGLCQRVFSEELEKVCDAFCGYGVPMPSLKIRTMKTRWGSCTPGKNTVTLNRRLLEAPRSCIEYVVMHELCHFIYPDHSRRFYALLSSLMPDWPKRKKLLEETVSV